VWVPHAPGAPGGRGDGGPVGPGPKGTRLPRPAINLLSPRSPRGRRLAANAAAGLALLAAALMLLHATGLLVLVWETRGLPPDRFFPDGGHAFSVDLGVDWMADADVPLPNAAVVREDGRPLPLPATSKRLTGTYGAGRYIIERGTLHLSSRDGDDPRSGLHAYTLRWPRPVPTWARYLVYGAGLAGLVALLRLNRLVLRRFWPSRAALWTGLGAILGAAALTRLPFFLFYRLPGVEPDTFTYLNYLKEGGGAPVFAFRSPGYPLFLMAAWPLGGPTAAIALQTGLSVGALCLLAWAVHRAFPALTLPAALVLAGVAAGPETVFYETSILSDSLFATLVLAASAGLMAGLATRSPGWLALASAAMAGAVLVRPAGLFYAVIYVLALAFLAWNRAPRRALAAFAAPFAGLLLVAATYNAATFGRFTVTAVGGANLAAATAPYWEPSPDFAPEVNRVIAAVTAGYPEAERRAFVEARTLDEMAAAVDRSYGYSVHVAPHLPGSLEAWDVPLRAVALRAIRDHPEVYARFVLSGARRFFVDNVGYPFDLPNLLLKRYGTILQRLNRLGGRADPRGERAYGRFYRNPHTPGYRQVPAGGLIGLKVVFHPTGKPGMALTLLGNRVREAVPWGHVLAAAWVLAAGVLLARRGRDPRAAAVVLLGLTVAGGGLVVALSEEPHLRYSFPFYFLFFLVPLLTAGLWTRRPGNGG